MKKVSLIIGSFIFAMTLLSCGEGGSKEFPGFEKIEDGLYVKYFKKNEEGKKVNLGDIVSMEMTYATETDSVLFSSASAGQPIQMRADSPRFVGDISRAFLMMHVGDSVKLIASADSFFLITAGMSELPPFIDSASNLHFSFEVVKVESLEEIEAAEKSKNSESENSEKELLNKYLSEEGITTEPEPSGLIFISTKKGTGKQAEAGKTVKVNYSGMLLDGTYFDTSLEEVAKANGLYKEGRSYNPLEFPLGQGNVIKGWDEGIAMMKVGGTAKLIIPSNIAYGANPPPRTPIKPFATLVFDVELVDVID